MYNVSCPDEPYSKISLIVMDLSRQETYLDKSSLHWGPLSNMYCTNVYTIHAQIYALTFLQRFKKKKFSERSVFHEWLTSQGTLSFKTDGVKTHFRR